MRAPIAPSPMNAALLMVLLPSLQQHRELRRHLQMLYPDSLRVHESMKPEMRKLPAVPAVLDSADRDPGIGRGEAIDEYAAGVEVTGDLASRIHIPGPYIAAETELACIRRVDGSVDVRDAHDRGNGTECLFVEGRHPLRHSAEHRRHVEGSLSFRAFAPAEYPCAPCNAAFHLPMQGVPEINPCHRSHMRRWIRRVAHPNRLCRLYEQLFKFIRYLFE